MSAFRDQGVARAKEGRGARHATGRPEELGLVGQGDTGVGREKLAQLVGAVVRVDDDPPQPGRRERLEHMGERGSIAHRHERLRENVGQRSEARAQPGGEDHRWKHRSSLRQSWSRRRHVVGKPPMEVRHLAALALLVAGPAVASGCGTDAVDVDGCRQIEEARCRQIPACGIVSMMPWFTSGTTVDACVRYYDDACLHGLAVADPGPSAVSQCVAAIEADTKKKDNCAVVTAPQSDVAACGWLVPPAAAVAEASDAPSEAAASADAATE